MPGLLPMDYHVEDTICAVASAPGGSLRGIVRLSGPDTIACLSQCFRSACDLDLATLTVAQVVTGHFYLEPTSAALPCDLFLWPNERSYTRQPAAELHTIGSPPLLDRIVSRLCEFDVRSAEPGEFTLRAFLAGRLDLTQVEAVLAVVDAEDQASLNTALSQLAGDLAHPLQELRSKLLELLAHLEAGLDFAEEEIEFISPSYLAQQLDQLVERIDQLLNQVDARRHSTSAIQIVLRGWPNTGKSSLLNALVDQPTSIVSSRAGTTRDYVVQSVAWNGLDYRFIDTAGITQQLTPAALIDAEAQQFADQQANLADLELFCIDSSRPLNAWETETLSSPQPDHRLVVLTKIDQAASTKPPVTGIPTSGHTGQGIEPLRAEIRRRVARLRPRQNDVGSSKAAAAQTSVVRCHENLTLVAQRLRSARQLTSNATGDELVAVELRDALDHLGRIVGAVYTDEILDQIFGRFCIGK